MSFDIHEMPISTIRSELLTDQVTNASSGYGSAAESEGNCATAATSGNASQSYSSGYYSRAAASGNNSIAEAMGNCSAAASAGNNCVAESMGSYSKSAVSGNGSMASASGRESIAMVAGLYGKAKAGENGAFALPWRDGRQIRIAVGVVGENGIKADAWYRVNSQGQLVEVTDYTLNVMYVPDSAYVYDC
ncbi:hypothetical protein LJC19_02995 [Oxalobacter sp. OttesenSCG-928-P03]|nr:hypothetical protein [Oxalobacter sp. OttesenSCG-928-P03]